MIPTNRILEDKIIAELEKKLEKYDSNCFQDVSSLALMHSQHEAALQRAQKTLDELEAKVDTIHAGVQQSQEEVFEKQMSHMREWYGGMKIPYLAALTLAVLTPLLVKYSLSLTIPV
jgi:prephenate dehydrogenase